ncbi:MAG: matrixin family metalloprotease [Bdellovibrionales bacterium]|nr:matrixin family metalloprotease [Bdellovibrionales bacterium]
MNRTPIFIIALGGLVCRSIFGMILSTQSVQAQLDSAVSVVELRVESKWAEEDPTFGFRWTAVARVVRVIEEHPDGRPLPDAGDTIRMHGIGGEANGVGALLSGYPRPFVGKRYRAYLQRDGSDYGIAGFEAGLVLLGGERQYSRNRTDGSDGSGSGPFLRWDPNYFPIPYFVSAPTFSGMGTFVPSIIASFNTWASVSGSAVSFVGMGCSSSTDNQNDGINNVIFEASNWPFETSVIAITRNFFISGDSPNAGMILDSDIIFNGVNHSFTASNEAGKFDVQNIMTHEIGHLLGLGHEVSPEDTDATMHAMAVPLETKKRDLATNDINGIRAAYPGVSSLGASFNLSCDISSTASCAATHRPCGSARSLIPVILFLAGLIGLGRVSPYLRRAT